MSLPEQVERVAELLAGARNVVLLSGAGLSTSAGIADFRGPNGLYRRLDIEDPELIFDIRAFMRDPARFYRFHREFLKQVESVEPTYTHRFFAFLERAGVCRCVVTQNIDSLHQRAGSSNVLEIHGGIWENTCLSCGGRTDLKWMKEKLVFQDVPRCDACGGIVKPDIVFFGEIVKHFEACCEVVEGADLLFVVGSSLTVPPAATLPARARGDVVVVNKGELCEDFLRGKRVSARVEEDIDRFFEALARRSFPGEASLV